MAAARAVGPQVSSRRSRGRMTDLSARAGAGRRDSMRAARCQTRGIWACTRTRQYIGPVTHRAGTVLDAMCVSRACGKMNRSPFLFTFTCNLKG
eukprot:7391125-Prymnesium_polylepis.2